MVLHLKQVTSWCECTCFGEFEESTEWTDACRSNVQSWRSWKIKRSLLYQIFDATTSTNFWTAFDEWCSKVHGQSQWKNKEFVFKIVFIRKRIQKRVVCFPTRLSKLSSHLSILYVQWKHCQKGIEPCSGVAQPLQMKCNCYWNILLSAILFA